MRCGGGVTTQPWAKRRHQPKYQNTISNSRNNVLEISNSFCKVAQTHAHHGVGLLGSAADRAQMSPFRFVLGVRRRCANALKNHLQSIPKALADRGYTPSTTTRAATTLPRYCPSAAAKGTRRGLAGSLHHWSGARRNPIRSYSLHAQATATRLHPGATLATAPARIYCARQWAEDEQRLRIRNRLISAWHSLHLLLLLLRHADMSTYRVVPVPVLSDNYGASCRLGEDGM